MYLLGKNKYNHLEMFMIQYFILYGIDGTLSWYSVIKHKRKIQKENVNVVDTS